MIIVFFSLSGLSVINENFYHKKGGQATFSILQGLDSRTDPYALIGLCANM
jgi:hypothetical protein